MEINTENLTHKFAQKIVDAEPLKCNKAQVNARYALIDYLAAALLGSSEKGVSKLMCLIKDEAGNETVPLIGKRVKATMEQAALFNGYCGHVLDFDDVHSDVRGHPGTVIFPTLISIGAMYNVRGDRFIASYIIGVEVMARLGKAIGKSHYLKGWHNTSTLGVIAAAVAGGYMLKFSVYEMEKLIGFACTQSFGLRIQFGTEAKPLHAGLAAQAAVRAIKFVKYGIGGTVSAFDGKIGFFDVYGEGSKYAEKFLVENWDDNWKIVKPGLWFKKYPCCSASHHAIDAATKLRQNYKIEVCDIEEIDVVFPPHGDAALIYSNPETCEQGKFSVEYIVALVLSGYSITFDNFRNLEIPDDIKNLIKKIKRVYDSSIKATSNSIPSGRFTIVKVKTKDKKNHEVYVDCPKGAPGNDLSLVELKDKLKFSLVDNEKTNKLVEKILQLKTEQDLKILINLI